MRKMSKYQILEKNSKSKIPLKNGKNFGKNLHFQNDHWVKIDALNTICSIKIFFPDLENFRPKCEKNFHTTNSV